MRVAHVLAVVLAFGCAKGGNGVADDGPADADTTHHDAHPQVVTDASMHDGPVAQHDAPVSTPDAAVDAAPLGPDASTDGMLCTANAQCTDSGECCLSINGVGFCGPGIVIGSTCLPQ